MVYDEDDGVVKVGSKSIDLYLKAVRMQMDKDNVESVTVSARGTNIRKAVEVAETMKNKDQKVIKDIITETQSYEASSNESEEPEIREVPAIHIDLVDKEFL